MLTVRSLSHRLCCLNHPLSLRISHHATRNMATKTIPVLDDAELKDGQMKEVSFGDGKVLLSRLGDKVHATSAFCTHYGAPLAKGTLTHDGRVVCPWHGASFNVCTGDIEDAPALDALHSFKAHVDGGKIHVTADPEFTTKAKMSRPPTLRTDTSEITGRGVVIVGGGSGAVHTVESLRENGYKGLITIVSTERNAPVDRTKLSKALITDPSKIESRSASDLMIKYGTTLRIGVSVTGIDPKAKTLTLDTKETIMYDTVVLATGGIPRRLPIEGKDLSNVYTLRSVPDAQKIDAAAQEGKRLVVIGSSFISMELVAAVSSRKLASIDVIGMEEFPFEAVLGKEVGAALKKFHESKGVRFHMQTKVSKIVASADDPSVAAAVEIPGETLPADFVIMGVGVAPATAYLKESGFELERDGGIKVDEYFRVPGTQDVYAIGDIAHYPQKETGQWRRIEHWNVAGNHGRAVGRTISGKGEPFEKIPIFWSAQGQQLRYADLGGGYDDVYIIGNPAELKFIAWYSKNGKISAVASMQNDPVVTRASELMRLGLMPTLEEIKAGKTLDSVDLSSVNAKV